MLSVVSSEPPSVPALSTALHPNRGDLVSRGARWLGWLALAGYALFIALHTVVAAGGSDSSGYLNSARLLAAGKLRAEFRVPPEFDPTPADNLQPFAPAGFNVFAGHGQLAPAYPSGLPLHFALAGRLLGWKAGPFLVQLGATLGAIGLCYRIARKLGFEAALAAAAAAMLAAFPVFIFTSIQTLSDTLATAWVLAAIAVALEGRNSLRWAASAGFALGMAVLVRPTNLLFAPSLVLLLGFDAKRWGAFVLGGVPAALWLIFYNQTLYGSPLRSGYGDIYADFGRQYAGETAGHFARWLAVFLPAVVLVLPVLALFHRESRRRELTALLLGFAAIAGVYLFYGISHEVWWCLRFILPGVPLLLLASLYGVEALAESGWIRRWRHFRTAAALGLALWAAGNAWYWVRQLTILYVPTYERAYADAARMAQTQIPANALVVCSQYSGALFYYTELAPLIFDSIKPEEFARYVELTRSHARPIYALLFDIEEKDVFQTHCPGNWEKLSAVGNIGLWRLR